MTGDQPLQIEIATDDSEAILAAYAEHGWGDGLPLVAPTEQRVTEMLAAVPALAPDDVIAVLPPRLGEATARIIAVNAVLAGCAPEHMAVLLAGVKALAAPQLNLRGVNATTHPVAPLLIVHG